MARTRVMPTIEIAANSRLKGFGSVGRKLVWMTIKPLLLIGGYGATGEKITRVIRRRNPDLPIWIAGRSQDKANALAASIGNAHGVHSDLTQPGLGLDATDFSAIGVCLHDPSLNVVNFAADHQTGVLLITGGAFEFAVDAIPAMMAGRRAPVVFAGHWFAGAVTIPALYLARDFSRVDRVEAAIVIDRDGGGGGSVPGPATVRDFERITAHAPSIVQRVRGEYVWTPVSQTRQRIARLDGADIDAAGSVSCDALSIGSATRAADVKVLEAWGVSASRAQGGLPADEVSITVSGVGADDRPMTRSLSISCPRTATSLTVTTAVLLLERLAVLDGRDAMPAGFYMSEHTLDPEAFMNALKSEGCDIRLS